MDAPLPLDTAPTSGGGGTGGGSSNAIPTTTPHLRNEVGESRVAGLEVLVSSLGRLLADARQELAHAGLNSSSSSSRAAHRKGLRNKSHSRPSNSVTPPAKPSAGGGGGGGEDDDQHGAGAGGGKSKDKVTTTTTTSGGGTPKLKRVDTVRRKEEIENAVRAWADSAPTSASQSPTAGSSPAMSPIVSPRAVRKRKELPPPQTLSSKGSEAVTADKRRNRANAVVGGQKAGGIGVGAEIMDALRRQEEERTRHMSAFFAAMERTYIEERERREREREELQLADLEREFTDMRARLREAIGCNARHAHELAERDKRIESLQAQIRLAQRRVAALERDARDEGEARRRLSNGDAAPGGQQQWRHGTSIGRERRRRTRSTTEAEAEVWPPTRQAGSGIPPSLNDVDDDSSDVDDDGEDEDEDVVIPIKPSSSSSAYTGVFFPSRRERLSSQLSGDRFMVSAARQTSLVVPFEPPGSARLGLSRETSPRPSAYIDVELGELERRRSHSFGHGSDAQHSRSPVDEAFKMAMARMPHAREREPLSAPVTPLSPFPPDLTAQSRPQVRIKEKNSKAFAVLGVDPTQAKLMSVLGIDMPMMEEAKKTKKIKDEDTYIAPSWDLRSPAAQKKNRLISRVSHKVRGVRD